MEIKLGDKVWVMNEDGAGSPYPRYREVTTVVRRQRISRDGALDESTTYMFDTEDREYEFHQMFRNHLDMLSSMIDTVSYRLEMDAGKILDDLCDRVGNKGRRQ